MVTRFYLYLSICFIRKNSIVTNVSTFFDTHPIAREKFYYTKKFFMDNAVCVRFCGYIGYRLKSH